MMATGAALFGVFVLLNIALGSAVEASLILVTVPIAFVGGILALLAAGDTWNVSSLVGLIGLFGIAVQNSLVLVTQSRALEQEGRTDRPGRARSQHRPRAAEAPDRRPPPRWGCCRSWCCGSTARRSSGRWPP